MQRRLYALFADRCHRRLRAIGTTQERERESWSDRGIGRLGRSSQPIRNSQNLTEKFPMLAPTIAICHPPSGQTSSSLLALLHVIVQRQDAQSSCCVKGNFDPMRQLVNGSVCNLTGPSCPAASGLLSVSKCPQSGPPLFGCGAARYPCPWISAICSSLPPSWACCSWYGSEQAGHQSH